MNKYWILEEQVKFGSEISSDPKNHACLVALFRIPIQSNAIQLIEYSAYETLKKENEDLKQAILKLQELI